MKKSMVTLALLALGAAAACSKTSDGGEGVRGASSDEFARVLDSKSPEELRGTIEAITKAHPDLKRPALYDSGFAYIDLDNPWIRKVQVAILPESGTPRGSMNFYFREGCCEGQPATAALVQELSKLDPAMRPVEEETVDAVAGEIVYRLGEHVSFSTDSHLHGVLSICTLQRGSVCARIAKAVAAATLPKPADLRRESQKK